VDFLERRLDAALARRRCAPADWRVGGSELPRRLAEEAAWAPWGRWAGPRFDFLFATLQNSLF
jgi:hypothetical protein